MYKYDFGLSFAGEDREYAKKLARLLKDERVQVFYDHSRSMRMQHAIMGGPTRTCARVHWVRRGYHSADYSDAGGLARLRGRRTPLSDQSVPLRAAALHDRG